MAKPSPDDYRRARARKVSRVPSAQARSVSAQAPITTGAADYLTRQALPAMDARDPREMGA